MDGIFEHFNLKIGEKKEKGIASISAYEFKTAEDPIYAMRQAMNGLSISDGKYVRLNVNGQLMMSDTDMEKRSNRGFIYAANGNVLIAGLGIGLILKAILEKPEVESITIIEKYKDVIDLVSPYFTNPKIEIIEADIFEWKPPKDKKYDTIYFDIWPEISTDNLEDIKILHNRFKNKLNRNNPDCWMNSWMKERLQREKRKERNYFW